MSHCLRLGAALAFCLLAAGCGNQGNRDEGDRPSAGSVHQARGVLRSDPDLERKTVLVDHEAIPNLMPAMTMLFSFREAGEMASLESGDSIRFALEEGDGEWWMHSVEKIAAPPAAIASRNEDERGGGILREGDPVPEFHLVDQRGRPLTNDTVAGQPFLLTFMFTRCPIMEFCPRLSENFRQVRDAAASDPALKGAFGLVSVSFDEQDTPEVLAAYGENFSADSDKWRFATGDPAEIEKLTQAFAVRVERESGTIDHSLATALIDGDGTVRAIWRGNNWQPEEALAAIRKWIQREQTTTRSD